MGYVRKRPWNDALCPTCNLVVLYGRYCETCGSKLGAYGPHDEIYCDKCGSRLAENERDLKKRKKPFCAHCGNRIL